MSRDFGARALWAFELIPLILYLQPKGALCSVYCAGPWLSRRNPLEGLTGRVRPGYVNSCYGDGRKVLNRDFQRVFLIIDSYGEQDSQTAKAEPAREEKLVQEVFGAPC